MTQAINFSVFFLLLDSTWFYSSGRHVGTLWFKPPCSSVWEHRLRLLRSSVSPCSAGDAGSHCTWCGRSPRSPEAALQEGTASLGAPLHSGPGKQHLCSWLWHKADMSGSSIAPGAGFITLGRSSLKRPVWVWIGHQAQAQGSCWYTCFAVLILFCCLVKGLILRPWDLKSTEFSYHNIFCQVASKRGRF